MSNRSQKNETEEIKGAIKGMLRRLNSKAASPLLFKHMAEVAKEFNLKLDGIEDPSDLCFLSIPPVVREYEMALTSLERAQEQFNKVKERWEAVSGPVDETSTTSANEQKIHKAM